MLEEQLQKTLSDLEKREKQLLEAEMEVRLTSDTSHNTEMMHNVKNLMTLIQIIGQCVCLASYLFLFFRFVSRIQLEF